MTQDVYPMIRAEYKQPTSETNRTMKLALPLYLCLIAGTGGVYTPANVQLAWANQQNQIVQIRGYRAKRKRIQNVSQHLIQIREMFGLKMTELAQILGVSRPTAYSWINGVDPREPETRTLINSLSRYVEDLRSSGVTNVVRLARQPLSTGESLIDLLKAGKDVGGEIASVKLTAAQALTQVRTKRDFGPASKVRRVRTDEISVPILIGHGDEA